MRKASGFFKTHRLAAVSATLILALLAASFGVNLVSPPRAAAQGEGGGGSPPSASPTPDAASALANATTVRALAAAARQAGMDDRPGALPPAEDGRAWQKVSIDGATPLRTASQAAASEPMSQEEREAQLEPIFERNPAARLIAPQPY